MAFRVSPEEDALIEKKVALSGLTKQEYITRRLQEEEIVVVGNPRVYKALKNHMAAILGTDIAANALSRQLNVNAGILLSDFGIRYSCGRKRTGRWIELKRICSENISAEKSKEDKESDFASPPAEGTVSQTCQNLPEEKYNM